MLGRESSARNNPERKLLRAANLKGHRARPRIRTMTKGATVMEPSTKDQLEGTLHEVKGAIKESAGNLTGNPGLEGEGKVERTAGKVQQKLGQVEKALEP
jgi:uncharacterized protein YjbJ (UPF0337 family)